MTAPISIRLDPGVRETLEAEARQQGTQPSTSHGHLRRLRGHRARRCQTRAHSGGKRRGRMPCRELNAELHARCGGLWERQDPEGAGKQTRAKAGDIVIVDWSGGALTEGAE